MPVDSSGSAFGTQQRRAGCRFKGAAGVGTACCKWLKALSQLAINFPLPGADEEDVIRLTRLNQVPLVVNADLIEHIEMTPDTVISLTTGQKFMVRETSDEVVERVIHYRHSILTGSSLTELSSHGE